MIGLGLDPAEVLDPICSRAGCREAAAWNVNWRNPRIHTADRVKVWLACDDHADYLRDYLEARDFPVLVTAVGTTVDRVPDVTSRA
ncbi:hypothetical protein [Lacisediminihabitans changchengi]|uniref:Acetone carboxylase n=1 Tax=Lacisediminihabitans changchengi TaxID=2787634 RepID=A0A934W474_9MICO|nr:hypothetical protein [Lacisediminihabitans changchengi]MBK4346873.1 hypothetical protein [Lacisediminihabitans changchengi]MBK4348004.1 hypothetical protein [Lacisediminihabitans changchengi]